MCIRDSGNTAGGAPYSEYICLSDDDYQLTMVDSWGDGWNGNIWSLYKGDFDGDLAAQCTLETGTYEDCFFTLGTPPPPESCEESNQTECENDDTCDWVNNTIIGSCSGLSSQECYTIPECNWACSQWGSWYSWICYGTYYCAGGNYQIDNSYCQENQILECSDFSTEFNCNQSDMNCDWIEDVQYGNCAEFDNNSNACNTMEGCNLISYQQACTGGAPSDCPEPGCGYSWLEYTCSVYYTVSYCDVYY